MLPREWRDKILELEDLRIEWYNKLQNNKTQDIRDLSRMKELYLKALYAYSLGLAPHGLTPLELYEKKRRKAWLQCGSIRLKTISMSLLRLKRAGLAERIREGHMYRYFITQNGKNRLRYYETLNV